MPKATKGMPKVKVTLRILPGPVTPLQRTARKLFFARLIAAVSEELRAESEGRNG